jgi:SMC interacting uncharacterized protein involved in chromosome segregation
MEINKELKPTEFKTIPEQIQELDIKNKELEADFTHSLAAMSEILSSMEMLVIKVRDLEEEVAGNRATIKWLQGIVASLVKGEKIGLAPVFSKGKKLA